MRILCTNDDGIHAPGLKSLEAIARELSDVVKDFDGWMARELSGINSELTRKKLQPIMPLTHEEWDKQAWRGGGAAGTNADRDAR